MQNRLYLDAIKYYKKEIKKNETGELHQKIGKAYLYSKDYTNAEIHYQKSLGFDNSNDSSFFEYAKILVILNHRKEAKKYFDKYIKAYPKDYLASLYIKSYYSILDTNISKKDNYTIENLKGYLNTESSEFGAVPYNNGLLYVSENNSDLVNDEKQRSTNTNYYSIFYSSKNETGYSKGKLFDPKINSDWHEGSIVVTPDKKEVYFSRTYRNRKSEVMQLFSCKIRDGKLTKPKPFLYNNKEYSIMHPTFSDDGKIIYFATNNPKGKGGWDIYYCKKDRKYGWSAPKPINGMINTAGDEVFPSYKNGKLYFASDGHFGYGGLDLLVASEKEYYKNIKNLGEPINSSKDDFAIYYSDNKKGFFSSNRTVGIGKDDIYTFEELLPAITVDSSSSKITGIFEYRKLAMSNIELIIFDEDGNEIDRIMTNKKGEFIFKKLKSGANYTIRPADDFDDDADLFITNSRGEKVLLINKDGRKFIYKKLKPSYTETLFPIEEEEPSFLILSLKGFVYRKLKGDLSAKMEVKVYDDDGNLIGRTYTESNGTFIFRALTPQNNYHFVIDESDEDFELLILNKGTYEYDKIERAKKGEFIFRRIKDTDEAMLLVNEKNELIRIFQNEKFSLGNILYQTNSAEIGIDAAIELNKLYILYRKNIHLSFIIESHTDSQGSDKYNLKLSEKRAKKVIDFLAKKGIPKENLIGKGYGETKLLNQCGNSNECSAEEHAINRRTEIKLKGNTTSF